MKRRAFFQNVAAIAAAPVAAKLVPDVPDIKAAQSALPIQRYVTMRSQVPSSISIWTTPYLTTSAYGGPWHEESHDELMAKADAARKGGK